ncbi:uncharacterized protein B0H18DRAFT_90635 [Fomitopsis serialis]|uniref:uncharacterized protein n=1 Tax=Fomitopsis serialis TaxID=139415 RepID=UPI002008C0DE|nr:uncharacterized protein B0H18DRAFT_90635 [Neoantrodia serialis]KAH9915693.1 hypothetical protein B0H18DRAFT_90635 [Neoantrodia serialis]
MTFAMSLVLLYCECNVGAVRSSATEFFDGDSRSSISHVECVVRLRYRLILRIQWRATVTIRVSPRPQRCTTLLPFRACGASE